MWLLIAVLALLNTSIFAKSQYFTDHPYIVSDFKLDSYVHLESDKIFRSLDMSLKKSSVSAKTTLSFANRFYASFSASSMRGTTATNFQNAFTELTFESKFCHDLRRSWQLLSLGYNRYMYPNQAEQTFGELFVSYQVNGYDLTPYITYSHQLNKTIKPSTYTAGTKTMIQRNNTETGITYSYGPVKISANMGDWKDTGRYYGFAASYTYQNYTLSYGVVNTKSYDNIKKSYPVVRVAYNSSSKFNFTDMID